MSHLRADELLKWLTKLLSDGAYNLARHRLILTRTFLRRNVMCPIRRGTRRLLTLLCWTSLTVLGCTASVWADDCDSEGCPTPILFEEGFCQEPCEEWDEWADLVILADEVTIGPVDPEDCCSDWNHAVIRVYGDCGWPVWNFMICGLNVVDDNCPRVVQVAVPPAEDEALFDVVAVDGNSGFSLGWDTDDGSCWSLYDTLDGSPFALKWNVHAFANAAGRRRGKGKLKITAYDMTWAYYCYCENLWCYDGQIDEENLFEEYGPFTIKIDGGECTERLGATQPFAGVLHALPNIPEPCCNKLPSLSVGHLYFRPASGTEGARGSAMRYFKGFYGIVRLPGRKAISTAAIKRMPWAWDASIAWPSTTFKSTITDGRNFEYVFEAIGSNGEQCEEDWDGHVIPLSIVRDPGGNVIREYDHEQGSTNGVYRITKQCAPGGQTCLMYEYNTNGGDPDELIRVSASGGRALDLGYDGHHRLTRFSYGSSGCTSCAGGQVLYYDTYVDGSPYNDLVIRREDLNGNVLGVYDYNSNGELTLLARGSDDPNDSNYLLVRTIDFSTNGSGHEVRTIKKYVSNTLHEKVIETERAPGILCSRKVYTGLFNTNGDCASDSCVECETTYTLATGPLREVTQLPEGNYIVEELGTNGSNKGSVVKQYRLPQSGSTEKLLEEFTYATVRDRPVVSSAKNVYGGTTNYEYHSGSGLLTYRQDPEFNLDLSGSSTGRHETTYDYGNNPYIYWLTSETRSIGPSDTVETVYQYDTYWNLTTQVEDDGGMDLTTKYFYNDYNELTKSVDPRGVVRVMKYDDAGHIAQQYTLATLSVEGNEIGNALEETQYEYNSNGQLECVKVADDDEPFAPGSPGNWFETKYEYDIYGRRTKSFVDETGGGDTVYEYDNQGRIIKTTTPGGVWTKIERDGRGLEVKQIIGYGDTSVLTTRYEYDKNGNLTKLVDPNGVCTTYEYDGYDRRTKATRGDPNCE